MSPLSPSQIPAPLGPPAHPLLVRMLTLTGGSRVAVLRKLQRCLPQVANLGTSSSRKTFVALREVRPEIQIHAHETSAVTSLNRPK